MEIIVDRKLILSKFLIPLSKFTDQAIITLTKDSIDCISYTASDKQSIILYTKLQIKTEGLIDGENVKLNIGSIKKLMNVFSCLTNDIIELKIENNNISHTSSTASFKFHLKEDGTIQKPVVNLEKINKMEVATTIDLTSDKIEEILKASNFSSDSNKIYFFFKDNSLFAEITDKTIQNLDSMCVFLTKEITGIQFTEAIPMRIDIFRLISSIKYDKLSIKFSSKGVIVFEITDTNYSLKYITSSLIK